MKEFKSVSVKNFFSYGPKEQTLDLSGTSIWNINGSNGKGKTTICIEAITFALYGKHREDKIDDCVNRSIKKNCKVSLEFIGDDDITYKIIRYRKDDNNKNAVFLFKGDKDITKKNAKDVDADIAELIGMPYIAFVNSTLFSSDLYSNFLKATGSERLVIFENILSLKEISIFYTEIKKILKELSEDEESANINYSAAKSSVDILQKQLEDYNTMAKSKLLSLKQAKEEAKEEIALAEEKIKELKVLDVDKERAKLSNNTLRDEYESQKRNTELEISKLSTVKEPLEEKAIISKYENINFEESKKIEKKYNEDLEVMKTRKEGYEKSLLQIETSNSKLSVLKQQINETNKELQKQNDNMKSIEVSICPFCGQKMNEEETNKKREAASKKIKELNEDLDDFEKQSKEENNNLSGFRETYNSLFADYNKIKENLNKNFIVNSELEEEKFNHAKEIISKYNEEVSDIKNKKEEFNKKFEEINAKINSLETTSYTEEYLNSVSDKIKEYEKEISDKSIEIATIDGSVKSVYDKSFVEKMKSDIEEKNADALEKKKKLDSIQNVIKHYEYLGECCSNKSGGFKKFFINEMIPIFNESINKYLPFFFTDKEVEIVFDKDLNDTIKVDGEEVSFSSFSRGQKCRAEIAASFALFNLSRIFFSNKSGLLIVDELLDNGLDEMGIKSAISVLESFAQDSKVFVVSHNSFVKQSIDNVIEIKTDENNFSYIA